MNFFHKVCATNQHKFVTQEHLPGPRHPAATNPQLRATSQHVYMLVVIIQAPHSILNPGHVEWFKPRIVTVMNLSSASPCSDHA